MSVYREIRTVFIATITHSLWSGCVTSLKCISAVREVLMLSGEPADSPTCGQIYINSAYGAQRINGTGIISCFSPRNIRWGVAFWRFQFIVHSERCLFLVRLTNLTLDTYISTFYKCRVLGTIISLNPKKLFLSLRLWFRSNIFILSFNIYWSTEYAFWLFWISFYPK